MEVFVKETIITDLNTGNFIDMTIEDVELSYTPSSGVQSDEEKGQRIETWYYTPEEWKILTTT